MPESSGQNAMANPRRFLLVLAVLTPGLLFSHPLTGIIEVIQHDTLGNQASFILNLSSGSSPGTIIDFGASSPSDYHRTLPVDHPHNTGVLLSCVSENGRNPQPPQFTH
ncbi:hypothetical protein [Haloferula sp.]|uniref:hypothetical protein n=1 Tax=Haloferula sp. TaxID=2497595 RepID=UPI00329AAD36